MVHLSQIASDAKINAPLVDGMEKLDIAGATDADRFTTSVYGSKFAAEDLPKHEMPEHEMPKEVAYRMIKDDLSLDGNPMLKYVSPPCPPVATEANSKYSQEIQMLTRSAQLGQFRYDLYGTRAFNLHSWSEGERANTRNRRKKSKT